MIDKSTPEQLACKTCKDHKQSTLLIDDEKNFKRKKFRKDVGGKND